MTCESLGFMYLGIGNREWYVMHIKFSAWKLSAFCYIFIKLFWDKVHAWVKSMVCWKWIMSIIIQVMQSQFIVDWLQFISVFLPSMAYVEDDGTNGPGLRTVSPHDVNISRLSRINENLPDPPTRNKSYRKRGGGPSKQPAFPCGLGLRTL